MLESVVFNKICQRIIPFLAFSYVIAIVDRGNLSFASVSMNADLHFSQTVYGIGVAAFFIGYSLFEVPSNLLLDRFGARRWLARIMATWGLVSMAMALVHSPWLFYALRFLLGVAEAGFIPGVAHYLSDWIPSRRRGGAMSVFYIASPIATVVTGALALPLLGLGGVGGLRGWQWLFMVEGVPALVMAAVLLLRLPDSPLAVGWLGGEEKTWLLDQLARDAAASGPARSSLWQALTDPIVLLLGLAAALNFGTANAITYSGPKLMIARMHGTMGQAAAMAVLYGLLTVPAMLAAGHFVDRLVRPFALTALLLAGAVAGVVAMRFAGTSPLPAYGGFLVYSIAATTSGLLILVLVTRYVHPTGRAAGLAMTNTIGQFGGFLGPVLWGAAADSAGGFELGLTLAIPTTLLAAFITLIAGRARRSQAPLAALEPEAALS